MDRTIIRNVVVLDVRAASEETIAGIERVDNVVLLLHSPETAALVGGMNVGNVVSTIEAPADAQFHNGDLVFGRDTFKAAKPISVVVNGTLIVHADVPREEIERGLDVLVVNGSICCPTHLAGAIQARLTQSVSGMLVYGEGARLVTGNLELDETYLRSLDDGSELAVLGALEARDVLPDDLLQRKVGKLSVLGYLTCHEENAQTLLSRLANEAGGGTTIVPAGYDLVDRYLVLDADLVDSMSGRKLYCTETVRIETDVAPAALDEALAGLVVQDTLLCPASLKGVVARKLDLLETDTLFYEGELWIVDRASDLPAARFDYLEGKATLIVRGVLTIASDVEPSVLASRLDKVHNYGVIAAAPAQLAAIQARLGVDEGVLRDATAAPAAAEPEAERAKVIANAVYLKL